MLYREEGKGSVASFKVDFFVRQEFYLSQYKTKYSGIDQVELVEDSL